MAKVIPLPVAPDAPLAIPLFEGALLHCVPCRDSPHVLLTLYGPRGGDAGGVVLHAERAALLGRWLQSLAAQQGVGSAPLAGAAPVSSEAPASAGVPAALLDPEAVGITLASLAVPVFADWWALDVVARRGRLRRLAVGHADPSQAAAARGLRKFPPDPRTVHPRSDVLRTGRPNVAHDLTDGRIVAAARSAEHLTIMRSLGCRSSLVVPLVLRRRVFGMMTFATAESGRRYDEGHVAAAAAFAKDAALALDSVASLRRAQTTLRRRVLAPGTRPGTTGSN